MLVEHDGRRMQVMSYKAAMMGRRPTSLHIDLKDLTTGESLIFCFLQSFPPLTYPSTCCILIALSIATNSYILLTDLLSLCSSPILTFRAL